MDLVKIGFMIQADGLKDANKQVDDLLTKVDQIGTKGKKAAADFSSTQKKVQDSTKQTSKVTEDAADKMVKRQQIMGGFLKHYDKDLASLATQFNLLSKDSAKLNELLLAYTNNRALLQAKKDAEAATKAQEQHAKTVQQTLGNYEKLSNKSLGGGILDTLDKQNKSLDDMRKHYSSLEKQQAAQQSAVANTVAQYEKLSGKSLGGGILDTVEKQNKGLEDLNKHYRDLENQQQKSVKAQQAFNDKTQKTIQLEQARAKYLGEGFNSGNSTKLAKMEMAGADPATLGRYKQAILDVQSTMQGLGNTIDSTSKKLGFWDSQIGGITKYAILSAAIYGVMSAVVNLGIATVKMADEYTALQNRMKLYITDAEELANVNDKLAQYAMANNIGLRETGTLFARLQPAMQKIGANTAAVTTVVDAFGKSMRIGGATAMEAASATLQFSQAMASGKLNGDEFRAISEASPRFLTAIADGAGIAAEKLKAMSSAGALTTEVISKALIKEYAKLSAENEKLGYTLEQGSNALKTAFLVTVGEFNEGAGATQAMGTYMMNLSQNMLNASDSAKAFGADVKKWFTDNAGIIKGVATAVELLAYAYASKYVSSLILARVETMKTAAATLAAQAAHAGVTRTAYTAATAMTTLATAARAAWVAIGGWAGLAMTVIGTAAAYALFNKESSKAGESLMTESASIEDTIKKFKELTAVKQKAQIVTEQANLDEAKAAYEDYRTKLISSTLALSRHNSMSSEQAKMFAQLGMQYKAGKITLDQLANTVQKSNVLTKESKDNFTLLAGSVSDAESKVTVLERLMQSLGIAIKESGEQAKIAGTNFSQMVFDAKEQVQVNKLAARYMTAFNLGQSEAVELAKEDLTLRKQGKFATMEHVKALKDKQQSEEALSDITKARAKAEKDAENAKKKADKAENKFPEQLKQLQDYNRLLQAGLDTELAKVASQKEYTSVYGENLSLAKEMVTVQKQIKDMESRQSFAEGLGRELEMQDRVVGFLKMGATYEVARSVAAARYLNDLKGREAVELAMTNSLYDQNHRLYDQSRELEMINGFLREGLTLEEARLRVSIARIQASQTNPQGYDKEENNLRLALRNIEMAEAEKNSIIAINKFNKEREAIVQEIGMGYQRAAMAAAMLAAADGNLTASQALQQLTAEDSLNLQKEQISNHAKLQSYLSGDNELVRDIKESYATLTEEQVQQLAVQRKNLQLVEAYANKLQDAKSNPLGDFSGADFSAFDSFGDPFSEAIAGANNYLATLQVLDENLANVAETKRQLSAEAEQAGMAGQLQRQSELLDLITQQTDLEKDYQAQKKQTNEIAFGQGLKFAKSFFKEGSKGYKVMSTLEKAYQGSKIAFALWEKKDQLQKMALTLASYAKEGAAFLATSAAKLAAQTAVNAAKGVEAVLTQGSGDPYTAIPRMAAMAAIVAGLGIMVGSISGGSSGSFAPVNDGTGTVFGDSSAKSESILKAMEILADNSDLGLPISAALLRSVQNIENSIGGVANLYIRGGAGNQLASSVNAGFTKDFVGKTVDVAYKAVNTMTFGLADTLTLGLFSSVGKFISKAFGTTTKVKGQGLAGFSQSMADIMSEGFELKEYVDVEKKKKSFGITTSKKKKTYYSDASAELENQFTLVFSNIRDSIIQAAPLLKDDTDQVVKALDNYVVNIGRVSTKGLSGEELQEALINIFSAEADKMAQEVLSGLDDFQQIGEGYYETAIRVAAGVEQAKYFTDRLNIAAIAYSDVVYKQGDVAAEMLRQSILVAEGTKRVENGFYDLVESVDGSAEEIYDFVKQLRELQDAVFATGKNGDYLTSVMMLGAGGLDALADGLDAYFEMLSPAEQAAELTRRLANEFDLIGQVLPADVKAFRDLVASIDITSEAGQKLYGQVIALAPEFNDLQDALENANDSVNALVKSLRDLAAEAMGNIQAQDQAQNLNYLRYAFEQDAMKAMLGDTAAAERLLTTGKDLMTLSKQYSADGSAYARDLAMIQQAATVAADKQEAGLGYTTPSLSTPAVNTDATVVQTSNAATDAKLETLREDMIAAMIAIAKSTQDTAKRLERWDYGDRMVVRVEQDSGETIPVKVTP